MSDALERAALSGGLFQGRGDATPPRQRSPSRTRSRSGSSASEDGEDGDQDDGAPDDDDDDTSFPDPHSSTRALVPPPSIPADLPAGNTGAKGVATDARAAAADARARATQDMEARRTEQASRAMVALTVHEEDALRRVEAEADAEAGGKGGAHAHAHMREREEAVAREKYRAQRLAEMRGEAGGKDDEDDDGTDGSGARRGKMGAIKEVGQEGFVRAVERSGWALVLIYEPDIARCQAMTTSLLALSLALRPSDDIALFRARAKALRFSLLPPDGGTGGVGSDAREDEGDEDEDELGRPLGRPDPDVLPTLLAYRDGELARTWVRVDWEVGQEGVEGLLRKEGILPQSKPRDVRGEYE